MTENKQTYNEILADNISKCGYAKHDAILSALNKLTENELALIVDSIVDMACDNNFDEIDYKRVHYK